MKIYKYSVLILAILFLGCERDDICAESVETTPRLLIEFFDSVDTDVLKSATRLSVYAERLITENNVVVLPETATSAALIFNSNSTEIQLPFDFNANEGEEITTRYIFEKDTNLRLDDNVTTDSNIDTLVVTYTPVFEYVSRACGFKTIFTNLSVRVESDDSSFWIQGTPFANSTDTQITVENENATHVQILH